MQHTFPTPIYHFNWCPYYESKIGRSVKLATHLHLTYCQILELEEFNFRLPTRFRMSRFRLISLRDIAY
jgi:hypothetical protein